MFGDPDTNTYSLPVLNLSELYTVGSSKRIYQSEQTSEGIPFLRISDLTKKISANIIEPELFISEKKYAELKQFNVVPNAGDILITSRGTLGQCYIIQEADEFYFQDGMISWLYNADERITPLYLVNLFEMPGFRKQIDSMQSGSTVNYLSISRLKQLQIMLPPIELQNEFVDFVKLTDKSKFIVQKQIENLQELLDSKMDEYFG